MPDDFGIDASDFSRLAVDLRNVGHVSAEYLGPALEVTAVAIRDTARENAAGLAHAPRFPGSITYDFVGDAHGGGALGAFIGGRGSYDLEVEIGPDKERPQGALGNLIEYGSVKNPPQGIMHGALQAHQDELERGVTKAIDDTHRAAGLL